MEAFIVHGPFPVAYEKRKGGRVLVFDDFWEEDADAHNLAEQCGCYVFALRNKSLVPLYVGKATKTFQQETFNNHNKHKYQSGFSDYAKGTPVMFFVVHPKQKGPANGKQIAAIESFLISAAVAKNPDLQNIKGVKAPQWSIKGVVRSKGKRSKSAVAFATCLDLRRH